MRRVFLAVAVLAVLAGYTWYSEAPHAAVPFLHDLGERFGEHGQLIVFMAISLLTPLVALAFLYASLAKPFREIGFDKSIVQGLVSSLEPRRPGEAGNQAVINLSCW